MNEAEGREEEMGEGEKRAGGGEKQRKRMEAEEMN